MDAGFADFYLLLETIRRRGRINRGRQLVKNYIAIAVATGLFHLYTKAVRGEL